MPVNDLRSKIKWPNWAGARYQRIDFLERFLRGRAYEHLAYPFHQERMRGTDEYIPLRDRRPSVIYNIPKIVVNRSVSMLFGDDHWPKIWSNETDVTDFFQDLVDKTSLQGAMIEAAYWGSLGSVLVLFSIVKDKVLYEVWNSKYCMPVFGEDRDLQQVEIWCPTIGYELRAIGFDIPPDRMNDEFFYVKKLDSKSEIIYKPILCDDWKEGETVLEISTEVEHNLGFVPGVWIKNMPTTSGIDADCTFDNDVLLMSMEIDYQLSQCGRGLKYNADPQLLIKEPPTDDEELGLMLPQTGQTAQGNKVRSTSNALYVGEGGDAKLLEISGAGQKAVLEFVKLLRQYALESARGSRKEPEKSYGNMSGRAMEILEEDLVSFASVLRISYGDQGLKPLLHKIAKAAKALGLVTFDPDSPEFVINFMWGNWFDPTPNDLVLTEQALDAAVKNRRMFMSEARAISSAMWGVGHSKPDKMDQEWPIPPMPEIPEMEMAKMAQKTAMEKSTNSANPTHGDNRRSD